MTVSEETAKRIADALERLADVQERMSPPPGVNARHDCGCMAGTESTCQSTACPRRASQLSTVTVMQ